MPVPVNLVCAQVCNRISRDSVSMQNGLIWRQVFTISRHCHTFAVWTGAPTKKLLKQIRSTVQLCSQSVARARIRLHHDERKPGKHAQAPAPVSTWRVSTQTNRGGTRAQNCLQLEMCIDRYLCKVVRVARAVRHMSWRPEMGQKLSRKLSSTD